MTLYIDNLVSEGLLDHKAHRIQTLVTTVGASTLTLTLASEAAHVFTGSTAGQIVKLPDATTLEIGFRYQFNNDSTQNVAIQDSSEIALVTIPSSYRAFFVLTSNGSAAGEWSYTLTPKVTNLPLYKAGVVDAISFTGNPKTAAVLFTTAFPTTDYTVTVTGTDGRSWIVTNIATTGFTISAQANAALTGSVYWQATLVGESSY